MTVDRGELVRDRLRQVRYPGFDRDIISMGFVKEIQVNDDGVTIEFSPNTRNEEKVLQMEGEIRKELSGLKEIGPVKISRMEPFADSEMGVTQGPSELPPEMRGNESGPVQGKAADSNLRRADIAPGAGYGDGGPAPFGGPESADAELSQAASERYDGKVRVCQWDIDPNDSQFESGEANTLDGDWEFRLWWQVHPERLVYVSIHALREDWVEHTGEARPHPVGRAEAVNLVYDLDSKVVVAIYGTVRDFRPFVEAFHEGYLSQQ